MTDELINQFNHFWKTFNGIVNAFDEQTWLHSGVGAITLTRISFHILQSAKFYIGGTSPVEFKSGKSFEAKCSSAVIEDLPSQDDISTCIQDFMHGTESWLNNIDYSSDNMKFDWTGKTMLSVVLFLLRHNQYHLGEINALLEENKKGKANDYWVSTL